MANAKRGRPKRKVDMQTDVVETGRLIETPPKIVTPGDIKAARYHNEILAVRVHRINCPEESRNDPIMVCVNNHKSKKVFRPGTVQKLTRAEVLALKQARLDFNIPIPDNSGIYHARDPMEAAKEAYPACYIEKNARTGKLEAVRSEPQYSIEADGPDGLF